MSTRNILLVACLFLASCGSVTETGNPCPAEGCAEGAVPSPPTEGSTYQSSTYNVRMSYPSSWTATEPAASDQQGGCEDCAPAMGGRTPDVTFSSDETPETSVDVYFEAISGAYTTLSAYLQAQYPSYSFSQYDTTTLTGYLYDDPAVGASGGDMRDYFFSNGSVLVTVIAEVFQSGEADMETLLNGISFF